MNSAWMMPTIYYWKMPLAPLKTEAEAEAEEEAEAEAEAPRMVTMKMEAEEVEKEVEVVPVLHLVDDVPLPLLHYRTN